MVYALRSNVMPGINTITITIALASAVALGVWWLSYPEASIATPVVEVELGSSEARIVPVPVVPERAMVTVAVPAPKMFKVADLTGLHEKNVKQFNRAMKRAGKKQLLPDVLLSDDELGQLADMHRTCSEAINEAARAVLDLQDPYVPIMTSVIKKAVDAGETVPYPYIVLPGGDLPDRGPYDLLMTSDYLGAVYSFILPIDANLMEIVDKQRMAEELRINAYMTFLAGL